jgi:hypothetical protein
MARVSLEQFIAGQLARKCHEFIQSGALSQCSSQNPALVTYPAQDISVYTYTPHFFVMLSSSLCLVLLNGLIN